MKDVSFNSFTIEQTAELDSFVKNILELMETHFHLYERRLEQQEEVIGQIIKAYTEMNTAVSGLIAEVMAPRSEEDREQFRQALNKRYKDAMNELRKVHEQETQRRAVLERADATDPSESILRMAVRKQNSSTLWEQNKSSSGEGEPPASDE